MVQKLIIKTFPNHKNKEITEREYYHPSCCIDLTPQEKKTLYTGASISATELVYTDKVLGGVVKRYGMTNERKSEPREAIYTATTSDMIVTAECTACGGSIRGPRRAQSSPQAHNYADQTKGEYR